jgi:MFS family permease
MLRVVDEKLRIYIRRRLEAGESKEKVVKDLLENEWTKEQVEEGLSTSDAPEVLKPISGAGNHEREGLPGVHTLLSESFKLYKKGFKVLAAVSLAPYLAMIFLSVLSALLTGKALDMVGLYPSFFPANSGVVVFVALVLIFVATFIIQLWGQTAIFTASVEVEESIGFKGALRKGWKKTFSYWWLGILSGFITLGGILLFVIPAIILSVWFSMGGFVLLKEDVKGMNALLKSREYIKGHWWGVLGRILAMGVVVGCVLIPIYALEAVAQNQIVNTIASLVFLVIAPVFYIYLYLLYKSLVSIKGSFEFVPKRITKLVFIALTAFGILVIPIMFWYILGASISPAEQLSKSRDARRQSDGYSLQVALEFYYGANFKYPEDLSLLVPEYLQEVPKDPKSGLEYQYQPTQEGESYQLCIEYEEKPLECQGPTGEQEVR